jgi:uncharacterized cupredoxin-like copper-binding protein
VRRAVVLALAALIAGSAVAGAGYAIDTEPATSAPKGVLGPGTVTVRVGIQHSRYNIERLTVRPGTTVRFVLDNNDPINHELIVGPPEVHRRHERGGEPFHPPVPGEVSVGAGGRAFTLYTFDDPGDVVFACHLPGHLAYGMSGTITVISSPAT